MQIPDQIRTTIQNTNAYPSAVFINAIGLAAFAKVIIELPG